MAKKRNEKGGARPRAAGQAPAPKKPAKQGRGRVLLNALLLAGGVALLTVGWMGGNYLFLPFGFTLLTLAVFGALERPDGKK